jgi:hypothetical protein
MLLIASWMCTTGDPAVQHAFVLRSLEDLSVSP